MKSESSLAVAAITMSSTSAKDSRRRQYRSCDRCRVGKRACNAEYDSVAEAIHNKVACSNCRKKGKTCSFQYVLSILGGVPTSSGQEHSSSNSTTPALPLSVRIDTPEVAKSTEEHGTQHHKDSYSAGSKAVAMPSELIRAAPPVGSYRNQWALSGSHSSNEQLAPTSPSFIEAMTMAAAAATYKNLASISPMSSATRITTAIDRIFLNDGLIRVYEGAAEQALQCWITSSNTPYMLLDRMQQSSQDSAASTSSSSSQKLVYWRICELDRGARTLLGHATVRASREKEIMDAFHSAVLAFAAQWSPHWISGLTGKAHAQGSERDSCKTSENKVRLALWERARDKLQKVANVDSFRVIFALIIFAWTEKPREVLDRAASDADVDLNSDNCALDTSAWQSPAEGSTFLLVAAMRKLLSIKFKIEGKKRRGISPWNAPNGRVKGNTATDASKASVAQHAPSNSEGAQSASSITEEESAHSSERVTMARKIQSDLESKAALSLDSSATNPGSADHASRTVANATEISRMEGTYHMLYWLCVVIDTETSVLRKHPPVGGEEDGEVIAGFHGESAGEQPFMDPATAPTGKRGIWDDYILDISKRKQHTEFASSWPCDEKKAAATLAFSTPVKVVMFRQISRLQMSFWRRASTQAVEQHIRSGLSIIYHWNQIYGRLIDSCRESHASLPASIQSWYVLLAFPWYLAILLFVEMVQTVDMAGSSDKQARFERARSGIFPRLRDRACSDLALLITAIRSTSFTHLEPTFQYVRDSGGNLLLTEPWSEILVHSITAVVKTELKLHEGYCSLFQWKELEESHSRIEECLWALDQLSDRSPSAQMAHEQLEKLTSARRQGSFGFQQIPMASPPLQRQVEGPSPGSDVDSNRASGFEGSIDGGDTSVLGFGEPNLGKQDPLGSALGTFLSDDACSARDPAARLGQQGHMFQLGMNAPQPDYLQLLQMLQQTDAGQATHHDPSTDPPCFANFALNTSAGAQQLSIEPMSILETLAQLTNQPVRDLLSLGSDASSSSVDTAFSLDSADWNLDFRMPATTTRGDMSLGNPAYAPAAPKDADSSSTATSVTSCSESESEDGNSSPVRKKAKCTYTGSTTNGLAMSAPPLQFTSKPFPATTFGHHVPTPVISPKERALSQKFMSVPLQSAAQRQHDDLYGDDDDDDLISYRDVLKRKRSNQDIHDNDTLTVTP